MPRLLPYPAVFGRFNLRRCTFFFFRAVILLFCARAPAGCCADSERGRTCFSFAGVSFAGGSFVSVPNNLEAPDATAPTTEPTERATEVRVPSSEGSWFPSPRLDFSSGILTPAVAGWQQRAGNSDRTRRIQMTSDCTVTGGQLPCHAGEKV